jgi:hypothetical protein
MTDLEKSAIRAFENFIRELSKAHSNDAATAVFHEKVLRHTKAITAAYEGWVKAKTK